MVVGPSGTVSVAVYGAVGSTATTAALNRNSTRAMVPSGPWRGGVPRRGASACPPVRSVSLAFAFTVTRVGNTTCAPVTGAVIETDGGLLTLALTAADVADAPLSSVALAVKLYVPAG